jgi:lysophospholipase L1-like esterase
MRRFLFISLAANMIGLAVCFWAVQRLGGFKYLMAQLQHNGVPAMHRHTSQFYERMAESPQKDTTRRTVVLIGDSITEYGRWNELFPDQSKTRIINRGIAADQIEGVKNRLQTIKPYAPDVIALLIGVNDLFFKEADQVSASYSDLVSTIQATFPQTELVLQTVFPINNSVRITGIDPTRIETLNQHIRMLSKEKGLKLIETHDLLLAADQKNMDERYTSDGLHLNGDGYIRWASALHEVVGSW